MATFKCPECEREPYATLPAWKRHMTSVHSGYTADQVQEASGGGQEGVALSGEKDLDSAIASLTEDEETTTTEQEEEEGEPQISAETRKAMKQASKRIRARLDSLKEKISKDVPQEAFKFAGVDLEESESQWLADSINTAFDVFGVEFEVEPRSLTIRNPWLVLLYPILVISYIVIVRLFKPKEEDKDEQQHAE
jgi:hypothetical protein